MEKNQKETRYLIIEYLKIITNIILIILILLSFYAVYQYEESVQEAFGLEKPNRLIEMYEEKTNLYCVCYNSFEDIPLKFPQ